MAKVEVILPQMGEGIIEATITRWLVAVNNRVELDNPLVEIATDKVDSELPAPVSGLVIKHFFSEGEVPRVGDVIAIIDDGKEVTSSSGIVDKPEQKIPKGKSSQKSSLEKKMPSSKPVANLQQASVSPFIRFFAQSRGVSSAELNQIALSVQPRKPGTEDVLQYIREGRFFRHTEDFYSPNIKAEPKSEIEYTPKEGEEVIDLDRTRILIAQHMVKSVQTAPHVTSLVEADITSMVLWREKIKKQFQKQNNTNLTYTPLIVEAVIQALKEFPGINVSLLGIEKMVVKKNINIGIATALPDGNLIVPVLKNADRLNLASLAAGINDMTSRAREGKLLPGETTGGTFTITNLGSFGNVSGTPIINQPESAILAVGAIQKKPWVIYNQGTPGIGIRDIVTLSLSYDHRIIDGALGGAFLSRIGQIIQGFNLERSN